jgi:hypothetical protein
MKILFFLWLFSPVGIWSVARKQQKPCDESNRLNKVVLFWFVFTRYEQVRQQFYVKSRLMVSRWELIKIATFQEGLLAEALPFLKTDLWETLVINFKKVV